MTTETETKSPSSILLTSGNFFFKHRNALFPAVFLLMLLGSRPALFMGNPALDKLMVLFGALVALTGQTFRVAVIGYAYIKRGGKEGKVYADDLVIRGFYAHVRNPMYVGNFLIAVGISLVYGAPSVYYFIIPFFTFVYLSIVTAEENFLRGKFGPAYEEYERNVPRFIPNFKGLSETLKGFRYDWKRALRKDYGTMFGTLFGILFILIWKNYWIYGYDVKKAEIHSLFSWMIPIIAFYGIIRYLKLSKRLASPNS